MRIFIIFLTILVFSPLGTFHKDHNYLNNTNFIFDVYHYLVVRGKSFLVETETEEDYANVSDNDGSNERALKPGVQNKGMCGSCACGSRLCDILRHK